MASAMPFMAVNDCYKHAPAITYESSPSVSFDFSFSTLLLSLSLSLCVSRIGVNRSDESIEVVKMMLSRLQFNHFHLKICLCVYVITHYMIFTSAAVLNHA